MSGELVKVVFRLPQDEGGWPPAGAESMWANRRNGDCVELNNIPFFVRGFASGDVVRVAADDDGVLWVEEVVEYSDNCTIRIIPIGGGGEVAARQAVLDAFAPLGVEGEGLAQFNLVALHVPASADLHAVKRLVVVGEEEGRWHYEEGSVTDEWRAAAGL
ncbi:DUF4265 domain-containing protein [Nocardia otitidiscaviarum]|uniref:DUF4265 domain-containing protein n=1 Tax=Nocardia otitidiscaviarum TaxID=1823 RepID=A0A516NRR3_9NOCA|nr:DUF4265 domain-containing protein [Nocardia otitidiscaviarum]MCP9620805.1 DUF4265 domain-containing protein [Nocardia otitidiscaviarum]QDP81600.1 DUF4265 domain-containing protein [Nocardia otitidiscaviarum]